MCQSWLAFWPLYFDTSSLRERLFRYLDSGCFISSRSLGRSHRDNGCRNCFSNLSISSFYIVWLCSIAMLSLSIIRAMKHACCTDNRPLIRSVVTLSPLHQEKTRSCSIPPTPSWYLCHASNAPSLSIHHTPTTPVTQKPAITNQCRCEETPGCARFYFSKIKTNPF